MSMEKFERKQDLKSPAITIRKRGSISFNAPAVKQFPILDKRFATLYFDKDQRTMGIQLSANRQDPSAFPIVAEKGKTPNISCQGFLRHCGVPFKGGSKVYPLAWDPDVSYSVTVLH